MSLLVGVDVRDYSQNSLKIPFTDYNFTIVNKGKVLNVLIHLSTEIFLFYLSVRSLSTTVNLFRHGGFRRIWSVHNRPIEIYYR